jgi:hypothetical protein
VGQSYSAFTATLAAMITPATVAVVLGGAPSCLVLQQLLVISEASGVV